MPTLYNLQASGVMFETLSPKGWTVMFAVCVTDENGNPVEGLKKPSFSVWSVTPAGSLGLFQVVEIGSALPLSKLSGAYSLQTKVFLGSGAPHPQQFLFVLRVSTAKRFAPVGGKKTISGQTTVAVTYLGDAQ